MPVVVKYGVMDGLDDEQVFHVYPTFGREHQTSEKLNCWCDPRVEFVHGKLGKVVGAVIIHEVEQ